MAYICKHNTVYDAEQITKDGPLEPAKSLWN